MNSWDLVGNYLLRGHEGHPSSMVRHSCGPERRMLLEIDISIEIICGGSFKVDVFSTRQQKMCILKYFFKLNISDEDKVKTT